MASAVRSRSAASREQPILPANAVMRSGGEEQVLSTEASCPQGVLKERRRDEAAQDPGGALGVAQRREHGGKRPEAHERLHVRGDEPGTVCGREFGERRRENGDRPNPSERLDPIQVVDAGERVRRGEEERRVVEAALRDVDEELDRETGVAEPLNFVDHDDGTAPEEGGVVDGTRESVEKPPVVGIGAREPTHGPVLPFDAPTKQRRLAGAARAFEEKHFGRDVRGESRFGRAGKVGEGERGGGREVHDGVR